MTELAADSTALLTLEGITKRYASVVANDGVSLSVQRGQIHAVLGENGAGKSTLMKIMSGALTPSAGNVSITPGQTLGELSQDQFAYEQYSVIDTVMMGDRKLFFLPIL